VSSSTPAIGQSVTYTATVTAAQTGAAKPSGSVRFLDGGTAISGCASRPLTAGSSSSTATCTLSYPSASAHSITAAYGGDDNFTGSTSSATTVTVPSPPPQPTAPANTSPPVISGTSTVGSALSASTGTWSGSPPISYAYQWQRCGPSGCANITGATGASYRLSGSDLGMEIRVLVVASNSAGSAPAVSSAVGPVLASPNLLRALLRHEIAPRGKAANVAALLKARGYVLSFRAPEAGRALIRWYLVPKRAHLAKAKPVMVAVGRARFTAAGTKKIKIKLTAKGSRLLKRAKRLKLTGKGSFTPTGGTAVAVSTTFTVKR
jgi:hypothetical protein